MPELTTFLAKIKNDIIFSEAEFILNSGLGKDIRGKI